ncbi:EamA family transporter [Burkholderiaceae bacterium DAT-1]|nr:EamA family transporter [Burkholderiaceae bacterium DAT-1]
MPNFVLYLASTLIWGSTWLVITFQFGVVSVTASVGYRFIVAGLLLGTWCVFRGHSLKLSADHIKWSVMQGLLMFMTSYMLIYESERHIASGLVAVLNSVMVIFNLIGMRLCFGRPIELRSMLGGALGITGIVLVFMPELATVRADRDVLWGAMLAVLAALVASSANMLAQRNRNHGIPLLPSMSIGMITGGIGALIISVAKGNPLVFDWRPEYIASLLYLAVFGSIIAFAAYLTLMGRIGAGQAVYVSIVIPIIALILSGFFEGFHWQWSTVAGIALAVIGNIVMMGDPVLLARIPLLGKHLTWTPTHENR